MTALQAGASPACPAVTWMDRGRARLSLARSTFVLKPPRERPSAWSAGSDRPGAPFFLAPAECWWARQTVESTETVQRRSSSASAVARTAARTRSPVPSMAHLIRRLRALKGSELFWQIAPGRAGAVLPRDGFQGPAVVGPPSSTDRIGRHQRLDPVPHRISVHQSDRRIRSTAQPIKETRSG